MAKYKLHDTKKRLCIYAVVLIALPYRAQFIGSDVYTHENPLLEKEIVVL